MSERSEIPAIDRLIENKERHIAGLKRDIATFRKSNNAELRCALKTLEPQLAEQELMLVALEFYKTSAGGGK